MLKIKLSGGVLLVKSVQMSYTRTETQHWYYNIYNWSRSVTGLEGEVPLQPMSAAEIAWVKRNYLARGFFPEPEPTLVTQYDPRAKGVAQQVAASMVDDGYYEAHDRQACAQEWARRYAALKHNAGAQHA